MLFRISYADIIKKINEERGLSEGEIEAKINNKLKQLSDLVSREGAAHIIANELGVKVFEDLAKKKLRIKDMLNGMRAVNLVAKVMKKYDVRSFKTERREGRVASMLVGDETGLLRIVLWDDNLIEIFEHIKEGSLVKVENCNVRDNQGFKELHVGKGGNLTINPEGVEEIKEIATTTERREFTRKAIKDLAAGEFASVLGTVIQVFEPRFYEACPECGKKVMAEGDKFNCKVHGKVFEKLVPILNVFFDDGTDNIRLVFFRDLVARFLGLDEDKVMSFRERPEDFEDVRKGLLGKQLMIRGRVNQNDVVKRLEFMAQDFSEVDPRELADELLQKL